MVPAPQGRQLANEKEVTDQCSREGGALPCVTVLIKWPKNICIIEFVLIRKKVWKETVGEELNDQKMT